MKVHKLEIFIIDHDNLGIDEIVTVIDNTRFSNDCINPRVISSQTVDIGEWSDDNPLNRKATQKQEIEKLFS